MDEVLFRFNQSLVSEGDNSGLTTVWSIVYAILTIVLLHMRYQSLLRACTEVLDKNNLLKVILLACWTGSAIIAPLFYLPELEGLFKQKDTQGQAHLVATATAVCATYCDVMRWQKRAAILEAEVDVPVRKLLYQRMANEKLKHQHKQVQSELAKRISSTQTQYGV